jgi:hypothetical protein
MSKARTLSRTSRSHPDFLAADQDGLVLLRIKTITYRFEETIKSFFYAEE